MELRAVLLHPIKSKSRTKNASVHQNVLVKAHRIVVNLERNQIIKS